jgi:arylsulfatase A-like enzyme
MPHLPVAFAASAGYLRGHQEGGPLGAVVEDLDSSIAQIWHALEKHGLAANTILAFSSDNGPWIDYPARMSGDSATKRWHAGTAGVFRGSKAMSYEGGIREPFILYWKGHTVKGLTLTNPISCLDILPTFAAWAHTPLPPGRTLDGQNIASLLTGHADRKTYQHRPIYIVNHGEVEAVRFGNWKYRETRSSQSNFFGAGVVKELFNLGYDPGERTNVIDEFPEQAKEGKALFDAFDGKKTN